MKIELMKKSDLGGDYYYVTVNDRVVVGSTRFDKDKAEEIFKRIVELKGKTETTEMIDCTIIED